MPPRRFYKTAAAAGPVAGGGFTVLLDDRSVRTPRGAPLIVDSTGLAAALAEEWAAQGDRIDPESMPLFRLVCTAVDRTTAARDDLVAGLLRYAETDLLCYRADHPSDLAARQEAVWQPLLDWLAERHAARLLATTGIRPVIQPVAALARLRDVLVALHHVPLTGLSAATRASGSLVIGLALLEARIDATEALEASQLDETYQLERWGDDSEAAARRSALAADLAAAERLFRLTTGD